MKSADDNWWLFETFPHFSGYRGQNSVLFCRRFDVHEFYQILLFLVGTSKIDFDTLILAHHLRVLSTSEFLLSPCLKLLTCGKFFCLLVSNCLRVGSSFVSLSQIAYVWEVWIFSNPHFVRIRSWNSRRLSSELWKPCSSVRGYQRLELYHLPYYTVGRVAQSV
jgi:hypothetical protein